MCMCVCVCSRVFMGVKLCISGFVFQCVLVCVCASVRVYKCE